MKSFNVALLILSALALLHLVAATAENDNSLNENFQKFEESNREPHRDSPTEPKPSIFPNQLDLSSLQNMPLIILHPRAPINLEMLPGDSLGSIHKALNPSKILELLQSATVHSPSVLPPQNSIHEESRDSRNLPNRQPQPTVNRGISAQPDSQFNDPALPRSLMNPNMNNGWFQRFRGSVSNMFPRLRPGNNGPFPLGLPTVNLPVFLPQPTNMHGMVGPFAPNPLQQFHSLPWTKFNFHSPSIGHIDLNTAASNLSPLRAILSNLPMIGLRPTGHGHPAFGGDLATSGSTFIPRRIIPPPHFNFALPTPPVQRHKPLFNNLDGLQAASMEISNAFADFTDSKEHGPEVTQRFGSVGHSINNFLKMMGLGSDLSFGSAGGFGGGADMAALDSTPIARSLDFYPGYGNQAHFDDFDNLDDIDDFPVFQEDITQDFIKKMNLTNETVIDDMKKEKDILVKEVTGVKTNKEFITKEKIPMFKGMKLKDHDDKSKKAEVIDNSYAPAIPLPKMKDEKLPEHPTVNYKIPPIYSTVAPHDRKQPIAIYQNSNSQNNNVHSSPTYVTAQAMPHREEEENPNKLVDGDVVRQWRLVNSGKGYVEKHPVPILDILQTPEQPESLKALQKIVSETVKKDSS